MCNQNHLILFGIIFLISFTDGSSIFVSNFNQQNQQSSIRRFPNGEDPPPDQFDPDRNQQRFSSITFTNGQDSRRPNPFDQNRNQQFSSSRVINSQDPRQPNQFDENQNQQRFSSSGLTDDQDRRRPKSIDQNQNQPSRADFESVQRRFEQEVLQAHNNYRARHCVPSLQLDDGLSRSAQIYAERLARANGGLQNQASGVGQNTYMKVTSAYLDYISGSEPTSSWYNGARYYDYNRGGFSMNTGSFTQLVWKSSRQLGVGIAYTDSGRSAYIVAQYYPGGNLQNDYQNNVFPAQC